MEQKRKQVEIAMTECQILDNSVRKRQQEFDIWVIKRGITKGELARKTGIHPSLISKIIQGKRTTTRHVQRLIDFGVPENLLPVSGKSDD
jgi:predicted transcriptional regulator